MKKFLSALTAFCMGASMIASVMPASALSTVFTDANMAKADGFTWSIDEGVVVEDGYAEVNVYVENDPGTGAYAFQMLINGKEFSDYGITIDFIEKGKAYDKMDTFVPNTSIGYAGGSSTTTADNQIAKEGVAVVTYGLTIPDDMADGEYTLSFNPSEFKVGDADGKEIKPTLEDGSLIIGDPSTATTEEGNNTNPGVGSGYTWYIEEGAKAEDGYAEVNVYVANDEGTDSYAFQMLINGKKFSDYGITIDSIEKGKAYSAMDVFVPNTSIGFVGVSTSTSKEAQIAKEGVAAVTYCLSIPDDMKAGTYELTFSEFMAGDEKGKEIKPTLKSGSLVIGGSSDPVEPGDDEFAWSIDKGVKVEDGYAEINVYVANDPGTGAYAFQMLIEGKEFSEYGITIDFIEKGKAYDKMDTFVPNTSIGYAGGSSTTTADNQIAKEGVAVVTYGLTIPDDMADGEYKLTFNPKEFKVGDADGKEIKPALVAGSLIIGDAVKPSEPDTTAPKEDDFAWSIDKGVKVEDGYAEINVYVANDPGTGAYAFQMLIEGKEFSEYGITIDFIEKGKAYEKMDTFVPNTSIGYAGGSSTTTADNQFAKEGVSVVTFGITVPDDMAEGEYALTFNPKEFKVGDADGKEIKPALVAGSLIIGDEEPPTEDVTSEDPGTDDGFQWLIDKDVYVEDGYAEICVYVANDPGTGAYAFQMLIEGKEFSEYGITIDFIEKGKAYEKMDTFVPNTSIGYAGGSSTTTADNQFAKEGVSVVTFGITVPDDMAEGEYALTFNPKEFKVGDADGKEIKPALVAGSLIIGELPTEEVTTEPTSEDPEKPTEELPDDKAGAEWIIGQVEAEAGETVKVPVTVKGDKDGINSYIVKMEADAALKGGNAAAGAAYEALDFVFNKDTLTFAGTNYTLNKNVVAADDAVVFTVEFTVPADAKAGTVYDLTFDGLDIYDIEMAKIIPTTKDGWIKVKATEETQGSSEIDAQWIIGQVEVNAGETAVVPVTVKGDKDGINSYILDMAQDAGPVYNTSAAGDAYEGLDFVANEANLIFAGTNSTLNKNIVAADDAVVFTVSFDVPADAAPGTVYDLTFEDLELYNIDMVKLIPTTKDGWIKVKDQKTTEAAGEWIIGTAEVEPGATVTIPVTVKGDKNGINSYILDMAAAEVDGAAPTAGDAASGNAYADLDFVFNKDTLTFAGTNYTLKENVKLSEDGATVFEVTFTVPEDAKPGTVYDLTFESLSVFDINMSELEPAQTPGWIKIKEAPTTEPTQEPTDEPTQAPTDEPTQAPTDEPTQAPTDEPTQAPTDEPTQAPTDEPTQAPTDEPTQAPTEKPTEEPTEPNEPEDAGEWIIGTAEVEPGATVTIPVTVKGDKNGINSYILDMAAAEVDGAAPTAGDAASGNAYAGLDFVFNKDALTFAGTNYTLKENIKLSEDGATVFEVTFTVPENAKPGTVYDLTFESLSVYDIDMNELTTKQTPGWIKIKDVEPTDEPTEPTQAPTDEPTQAPTDEPTQAPTDEPTQAPTDEPTQAPTDEPTQAPTDDPTQAPTDEPTQEPTDAPTDPENPVVGNEFEMTGTHQFYFSHDPRNFKAEDLVDTLVRYDIYKDGTKSEAIPVTDLSIVKFDVEGWTSPKVVYEGQVLDENGFVKEGYFAYYTGNIPATITDEFGVKHEFKDTVTAYIAVKGDANLDGDANSLDSAAILVYAAERGAGNEAYIYSAEEEMLDMFAYFLADVTGESEDRGKTDSLGNEGSALDAIDAANILVYAAEKGAGNDPKWHETLSVEPLPKYTAEIASAEK